MGTPIFSFFDEACCGGGGGGSSAMGVLYHKIADEGD